MIKEGHTDGVVVYALPEPPEPRNRPSVQTAVCFQKLLLPLATLSITVMDSRIDARGAILWKVKPILSLFEERLNFAVISGHALLA